MLQQITIKVLWIRTVTGNYLFNSLTVTVAYSICRFIVRPLFVYKCFNVSVIKVNCQGHFGRAGLKTIMRSKPLAPTAMKQLESLRRTAGP